MRLTGGADMSHGPAAPLIAAKQAIPPERPGAVRRSRLHTALLDTSGIRLTVVVAPAGWGKTTLLTQWAHDPAETRGVVWVSLDETDDDPVRFWTYVLTALQRQVPGLSGAALAGLTTAGLEPVDLALPTLLNELTAIESRHVLVLDDYHLLANPRVHEGVEFLLAYLPPALRIVLAGRSDPPLPLARLRARGELREVRVHDLGFSVEEAAELLGSVGGTRFDLADAAAVCARTEGWATGLQLTALTVRGAPGRATVTAALQPDDRHVLDYLATEVLAQLRVEHRDLLVRTSVLERLSGSLCDHVLDQRGSAAILDELDRADLFVVPLDPARGWYRCHRLFRDVLLQELSRSDPLEAQRVLSKAADWFLAGGYIAEAADHRIRAGDEEGAAALLRSRLLWFLERGASAAYLQLARRLPLVRLQGDPALCVSLAWAEAFRGDYARMGPWLDAAEPSIADDSESLSGWRTLRGAAATMRARWYGTVGTDVEAGVRDAARAVELEDDPSVLGYVVARTVLGTTLGGAERHEEAVGPLSEAWRQARLLQVPPLLALQVASALALALLETGQVDRLRRLLADMEPEVGATADPVGLVGPSWAAADSTAGSGAIASPGTAQLWTVQGRLAHHDGDLASARRQLEHAVELARAFGGATALVAALTGLAEVVLDAGDPVTARGALQQARDVLAEDPIVPGAMHRLAAVERRAGRGPAREELRPDVMVEELTDREHAVLRALTTDATQREIGASLYLSINTVKGYTKILYRKLGVTSREDAVFRARALGLL